MFDSILNLINEWLIKTCQMISWEKIRNPEASDHFSEIRTLTWEQIISNYQQINSQRFTRDLFVNFMCLSPYKWFVP
jgi:hypothetical protein